MYVCVLTDMIFRRTLLMASVYTDRKVDLPEHLSSLLLSAAWMLSVSVTISDMGTDCHLLSTSVL